MHHFRVYSKPGCHLCDRVKHVLERCRARTSVPFSIEEVDISQDAELMERYGTDIPVITLDEQEVCRHFLLERHVLELLES